MKNILIESCSDFINSDINESYKIIKEGMFDSSESFWKKITDFIKKVVLWIRTKILTLFGKFDKNIKTFKLLLKDSELSSNVYSENIVAKLSIEVHAINEDISLLDNAVTENKEGYIEGKLLGIKRSSKEYDMNMDIIKKNLENANLRNYKNCITVEKFLADSENTIKTLTSKLNSVTSTYRNITQEQAELITEFLNICMARIKDGVTCVNTIMANTPLVPWHKRTDKND
jgi:hypothetical protein